MKASKFTDNQNAFFLNQGEIYIGWVHILFKVRLAYHYYGLTHRAASREFEIFTKHSEDIVIFRAVRISTHGSDRQKCCYLSSYGI